MKKEEIKTMTPDEEREERMVSKEEKDELDKNSSNTKKNKKEDKIRNENEKLKADLEHWKNEYYRAYADIQNLRKSLEKDHLEAMKYRAEGFIEELLPVLDSFHLALKNEPKDEATKNYLIGFQFIYKNLVAALENEGVTQLAPKKGDKFNPSYMNAIDAKNDDGEENRVLEVYANGYKLKDRLIRPANVVVSKKPEIKKDQKDDKTDA